LAVRELLDWFPKRHEDRRRFDEFPAQVGGEPVCLRGTVIDAKRKFLGGRRSFYEVTVEEAGENFMQSGQVVCRWFNMPYISKMIAAGHEVILYGKPKVNGGRIMIDHPEFEILKPGDSRVHVDRIVPIYRNISGVTQRKLRELIWEILESVEWQSLRPQYDFGDSGWFGMAQAGRVQGKRMDLLKEFHASLPFDLTDAQKRCVKEVIADMRSGHPMNRLLQGDVGSGKTMVAMCAMLLAVDSGHQAALMAPTQILAEQHYVTFCKMLAPLGVKVRLITGARFEESGEGVTDRSDGEAEMIIGTHALLYERASFVDLGMVVIDEQHKFGVAQRGKLIRKNNASQNRESPPLRQGFGGHGGQKAEDGSEVRTSGGFTWKAKKKREKVDLDEVLISGKELLEKKENGEEEKERVVEEGASVPDVVKPKVTDVGKFLKLHLEEGRQIYLVYPLVEESDKLKLESAVEAHEKWQKRLKHFEVGLLHGKMSPQEKMCPMPM